MKIGLLCNFYGFPQYTDKVLAAWKNISEVSVVAVSSFKYQGYADCGWDIDDTETPVQLLTDHRDFVDHMIIGKDGNDSFARNPALFNILDHHDVDFVWLLDQDEIYSEEDIRGALKYISENRSPVSTFRINFKNFVFSEHQYVEDFKPPRIFSVNFMGYKTLSHFYYENDVNYVINGKKLSYKSLPISCIPKEVCFPDHYSWIGSPEFLKAKIKYQLKRYAEKAKEELGIIIDIEHDDRDCSYRWNEKKGRLEFNKDFYKLNKIEIPDLKCIK